MPQTPSDINAPSPHRFVIGNKAKRIKPNAPEDGQDEAATSRPTFRPRFSLNAAIANITSSSGHDQDKSDIETEQTSTPSRPAIVPRFTLPSAELDQSSSLPKRSFLRSDVSARPLADPLPDAFSPRRRKQPFVPGGMAAELQTWVVDVGSALVPSGAEAAVTMVVDNWIGDDDSMLAQGRGGLDATRGQDGDGSMRAVLTSKPGMLSPNSQIRVRQPSWTVRLQDEDFWIGVDWDVVP